jgi:LPS O-antigen subunit length determinant protein (WzzB/FepE family)
MKESISKNDDEINLIDAILTIWNEKFKIILITLIFVSLGFVYINLLDNNNDETTSYEVSSQIKPSDSSGFMKYISTNDLLLSTELLFIQKDLDLYLVDNQTIFGRFIDEFMDHEELKSVLKKNLFVKKQISQLSKKNKEKTLANFAQSFTILKQKDNNKKNYFIVFNWHNVDEGKEIINETINLVLSNLKNLIIKDIEILIQIIKIKNSNKLQSLEMDLNIINQSYNEQQKNIDLKRIKFLKEQAQIAKELEIENNQLNNIVGIEENLNNLYYLFGYKMIEKEIDLIQKREYLSAKDDVASQSAFTKKIEINKVKRGITEKKLLNRIDILKNDKQSTWIDYDLLNSETTPIEIKQTDKKLILIAALSFGLIIGIMYVFISKMFQNRIKYLGNQS